MTATHSKFSLYIEDSEEVRTQTLCEAVALSLNSDVPVAAEVVFAEAEEIRALNREQRQVDAVTDVLSFPSLDGIRGKELKKKDFPYDIDENGNLFIGSIVICRQRAREQAEEYGHSYERELHYLLVHGIMHCLGYDHIEESDRKEMRLQEERVLERMGISRSGSRPA